MRILKIGGNELSDPAFLQQLGETIARLQEPAALPVVVVHGGGKGIARLQEKLGLETVKVDGLRVTDLASLNVAEMVLSGQSNKIVVKALLEAGVDAVGLSGVDGGLLRCRKKAHPTADLGYVGEIVAVRRDLLQKMMAVELTVVLSPISLGLDGLTYNVNADEAAGAVATACAAEELTFVSNVPGVLHDGLVLPQLTAPQVEELIAEGVISAGMIPKVRAALQAIERGVARARIVNLAGLLQDGGTTFVAVQEN